MDENTVPNASDEPPGDDLLRKLALALLAPRFAHSTSTVEPRLLVGQLPADLPFSVPLPEGARVLGTLLGADAEPEIVIESPLALEETAEFYRAALTAEGWREEANPGFGRGGFVHSTGEFMTMLMFDRDAEGPSLRLMCSQAHDGGTTVQCNVAAQPFVPSQMRGRRMMHHDPMHRLLPAIKAPLHANQQGGGSSSSDNHVDSRATLETDLDVLAVGAHYRGQLERAGWQLNGSGESGPIAWSMWAFKDDEGEPWSATFVALRQPNAPRRYNLWLNANYEGSYEGGPPGRLIGTQMHTRLTGYGPMRRG